MYTYQKIVFVHGHLPRHCTETCCTVDEVGFKNVKNVVLRCLIKCQKKLTKIIVLTEVCVTGASFLFVFFIFPATRLDKFISMNDLDRSAEDRLRKSTRRVQERVRLFCVIFDREKKKRQ